MAEPHHDDRPSSPMVKKLGREIRWDAAAAIIASLVGLLALLVAGYTAYIQREQVRAQVWPYLIGANTGASKLVWMNKGVGPAIVHSVEFDVDGRSQRNWAGALHSLGLEHVDYRQTFLNGNVLSPGEMMDWIQFQKESDYDSFKQAEGKGRVDVKVCYCSTLGECWQTRFATADRKVGQCPALPTSRQFQD